MEQQLRPGERRELWRRGDDSVYLTHPDHIGISCDGRVIEMDARVWHQLVTWQNEMFDRQCELFGAFGSQTNGRRTIATGGEAAANGPASGQ
jgi:hypothetical protein